MGDPIFADQVKQLSGMAPLASVASQAFVTSFTNQAENISSSIYGNLESAAAANEESYNYQIRSNNLKNIQDGVLQNVTNQADSLLQHKDTSTRQHEINEWANSDKLDTLFVFQFVFISLMVMALLGYLWRINLLSSGFLYFFGFILIVVNILIIVMRSKYTRYLRNTRYWNRRKFNQYPAPAPTGPDIPCLT